MKPWLSDQLEPIRTTTRRVAIVLDPDRIVSPDDLQADGEVLEAFDWFEIRKIYEHKGRRRQAEAPRLIILTRSEAHRDSSDLPFDIEQTSEVVRVRVPVPLDYRQLVLELPDDLSPRAIRVLQGQPPDPIGALVANLWGVVLPRDLDPAREIEVLVRLRSDPTVPPSLWPLLQGRFQTTLAQALAQQPADVSPLQEAWVDFLDRGPSSLWTPIFFKIGPRIGALFYTGLLRPAKRKAEDLPEWTVVGSLDARPRDRIEELRHSKPEPWPPDDVGGWARLAEWWGELRAALADAGADGRGLATEVWAQWSEIDQAFSRYIRRELGSLMSRSAHTPLTVDKIAPFLARRLRSKGAGRILLVVVDGMGLAQWGLIRRTAGLQVVSSSVSFAVVPTLTPLSRQAIFAGRLPLAFADTLRRTDVDERRWEAFWQEEGLDVSDVRYVHIKGGISSGVPRLDGAPVIGMVVQAVDDMLHASHVLGDVQAATAIRAWAQHGLLRTVVEHASREGYEVWVTSDHGNLEAEPLGKIHEGLAVESAGIRARWYADPALRGGARADGIEWDPPGLPAGLCYPLFAPGRTGYFSGDVRVTHGGFSLDEVIVPLTQVVT